MNRFMISDIPNNTDGIVHQVTLLPDDYPDKFMIQEGYWDSIDECWRTAAHHKTIILSLDEFQSLAELALEGLCPACMNVEIPQYDIVCDECYASAHDKRQG